MIKIFYRPAEVIEGGWQLVGEVPSLDDARDELASWQGPRLGHGDLVVVGTKVPTLFVFDGARGALVEVGDAPKTGWVTFWEGETATAASLFDRCGAVDRRRIVLAACAVAEISLKYVPASEDRPRLAIEAARRWARGEATVEYVGNAAAEATDAAEDFDDDDSYNASVAAYNAVRAAAAAAEAVAVRAAAAAATRAARNAADAADSAYAAYNAAYADDYSAAAKAVRRYIPLSVLACSLVGARDPLPMPRENPSRALGWIANPTTSLTAPAAVRREFARGLDLLRRGMGGDGLRGETVQWAERLARGEPATPEKLRLMRAWFARHGASPLEAEARHRQANQIAQGAPPRRAPALVAWLLWGGDAGRSWASQMAPRGNPTFLDHCVEKVGATTDTSLLSQREGKSRAYAICTASFQKAGYYRRKADGFSRTLTRAGTLAERRHRRHSKD